MTATTTRHSSSESVTLPPSKAQRTLESLFPDDVLRNVEASRAIEEAAQHSEDALTRLLGGLSDG